MLLFNLKKELLVNEIKYLINFEYKRYYIMFKLIILSIYLSLSLLYANKISSVLILHSYSQEYPWTKGQHQGFVEAISQTHVSISTEYLDTKRLNYTSKYRSFFFEYLKNKYIDLNPELIYVSDDNALNFILEYKAILFPDAKVVFSGINDYSISKSLDNSNYIGIFEKKDPKNNIEIIKQSFPNKREIYFVGDNSNTDKAIINEVKSIMTGFSEFNSKFLTHADISFVTKELAKIPPSVLILTTIGKFTNKNGEIMTISQSLKHITAARKHYVMVMEDGYLKENVIGGYVTSSVNQGHWAGTFAKELLQGKPIDKIALSTNSANMYIFDRQELKKHNILLPKVIEEKAQILNEDLSFWTRYKTQLQLLLVMLALVFVSFLLIAIYIYRRKNLIIENKSKYLEKKADELNHMHENLNQAQLITHLGSWELNLQTNILFWSDEVYNIFEVSKENSTISYDYFLSTIHPDDLQVVKGAFQTSIDEKSDYNIVHRILLSDGKIKYVREQAATEYDVDGVAIKSYGTIHDISKQHKAELFKEKHSKILRMIATGISASVIYDEIALMYEERHPGMRCSLLELENGILLHGGAPSMPQEYQDAVHGLKNGPNVGSCGTSTYTGKRMIVENIDTHPNWAEIKQYALPHGMRSCWSEPIKSSSGEVLGAFGMYYDYPALPNEEELDDLVSAARLAGIIMEREKSQKYIKKLAYSDILTNLPNRASFYQLLESLTNSSNRKEQRFAVLYIDLDDFKNVNDSLGHDVGDILLKEIANRLKEVSRDDDFTARLSGDEFCLLIKDINDDYDAAYVAKRCLDVLSKPLLLSNRNFTPACSIGIAHYPDDANDIDTLLKAADTALYFSKENGKNKYSFYTPELTIKAERLFQVEQYLREAIEKEELTLVYQPQINIKTNKLIGVEALSRWNHPVLGEVSPVEFIPIAEKLGLIKQLTKWVLKKASTQAVQWSDLGYPNIRMSVNISPTHFLDKDLVELIRTTIENTGIIPSNLELEVTENVVHTDEENLSIFKDLKALGVIIAIDDFGTGYSSFASLKHLSIDCIKLDKFFIDDMLHDEESQHLVKAMIQLGHSLKQGVIAEGVETKQQAEMLKELNCQAIQGYFFSKPLISENMLKFLEKDLIL